MLGYLAGLVILVPVFLAIRIEDGGNAFYRQERNGLYGKVFWMYKFRSMCMETEQMHQSLLEKNELDGPAFKLKNDPRVTKVGRFIRRTSLDGNVIIGTTTETIENTGVREVSPIHFFRGRDLISNLNNHGGVRLLA